MIQWTYIGAVAVAIAVFAFRSELPDEITILGNPLLILGALAVAIFGRLLLVLLWKKTIAKVSGLEPNFSSTLRVFSVSWLGRYIPGKVSFVLARLAMARSLGVSRAQVSLSTLLESLLQNLASLFVALATLISFSTQTAEFNAFIIPSVALVGLGVVMTNRLVLTKLLSVIRVWRSWPESVLLEVPRSGDLLSLFFAYLLSSVLSGVSVALILFAVWGASPSLLLVLGVIGVSALSSVASTVALFAPAGLGISESVNVAGQFALGVPLGVALATALLARGVSLAADLLFWIAASLFARR